MKNGVKVNTTKKREGVKGLKRKVKKDLWPQKNGQNTRKR